VILGVSGKRRVAVELRGHVSLRQLAAQITEIDGRQRPNDVNASMSVTATRWNQK
jgi:hypothetical protein